MDKSTMCSFVERLLPLLVVVGLVFAVAGCRPTSAPEPTSSEKPAEPTKIVAEPEQILKLGILGPFSGPAARTGDEFKGAATMAFDAINWQIGQYTVEPVWIDSQSDPDKAAQAYEQAVLEDGIQAGILNWHSSVAVSCMEVAAEHKIPHIFPFGATEAVNETFASDPEKYGYWMNKGWPTPERLTVSYVQALEDAIASGIWSPAEKTVAIYGENTRWGLSFGNAIKSQLGSEGWEVVAEEYFPLDEVQFSPLLNKFKAMNPALVVGTSTSLLSFTAFIKEADEVGLESLIIADGLGWFGEWYELTGSSSDYVLDQIPGWATAEGHAFAEEFEAQWGFPPSPSAGGLSYDGTNMFIQVAQHALDEYGELSSETIYKWAKENLQTGKWSYTDGIVMSRYEYRPETIPDPVVGKGYYIFPVLQYFDGEGKIIYPPEWAVQQLAPKP